MPKEGRRGRRLRLESGGSCLDCHLRNDGNTLNMIGQVRRHPWYGTPLSGGCEGCGGAGRESRVVTNLDEVLGNLSLTDKQRFVIELRYGLKDGNTYSLREIGALMGIHHERVRKLEQAGLKKIRAKIGY